MRKIPTIFQRNPDDMRHVTRDPHPDCAWVFAGEGIPTRKYDGTCLMFDGSYWWARREVKTGKASPPNFVPLQADEATGKTVGWEPISQSAFAKYWREAREHEFGVVNHRYYGPHDEPEPGTYELLGPKVNGNPEGVEHHMLVRHGYLAAVDRDEMASLGRDFDTIAAWLAAHPTWEGIVFHHPDGRRAKIKRRDFQ